MEALDKKIEEMLSEMENRVEAMHEHASTAANLKEDVASLRDGVRTVAATANDTCQALSDALKGFVETHNAALSRDSSAFGEAAGKAGASLEAASDRASAAAEAFEKMRIPWLKRWKPRPPNWLSAQRLRRQIREPKSRAQRLAHRRR